MYRVFIKYSDGEKVGFSFHGYEMLEILDYICKFPILIRMTIPGVYVKSINFYKVAKSVSRINE
jgi:hypothetical protein